MHENSIVHRDLKPENVVMSYVSYTLRREFAKYVTSDGLLSAREEDKHTVGHLIMCALKSLKARLMIAVWTSGAWEC